MTNADWWWSRVKTKPPEPAHPARSSGRVFTLHHGRHSAALDVRLMLSVNGELRRARFFWRIQCLELLDAISETEANLKAKGWVG